MAGMQRASIVRLGILLLILGATAIWVNNSTRAAMARDDERVRERVRKIIALHPVYEQQAEYIDGLLLRAHESAFDRHYHIGMRYLVEPRFDHVWYVTDVFAIMVEYARDHGIEEVVDALQEIGPHVDLAMEE